MRKCALSGWGEGVTFPTCSIYAKDDGNVYFLFIFFFISALCSAPPELWFRRISVAWWAKHTKRIITLCIVISRKINNGASPLPLTMHTHTLKKQEGTEENGGGGNNNYGALPMCMVCCTKAWTNNNYNHNHNHNYNHNHHHHHHYHSYVAFLKYLLSMNWNMNFSMGNLQNSEKPGWVNFQKQPLLTPMPFFPSWKFK